MIFQRFFAPGPAKTAGRRLAQSAMAQARAPGLYAVLGAPDTVDGRFELLTLHVIVLVDRLQDAAVRQALFDAYLADLDGALREMGVGDLAVGKRMRRLGQAFYGRTKSWGAALAALPDDTEASALLGRTVFGGLSQAETKGMARYVAQCHRALAAQDDAALASGEVAWPAL